MKTLNEWNEQHSEKYNGLQIGLNGIQCPICGEELYDGDPRMLIATFPPKRKVFCKKCGHKDYRVL